MTATQHDHPDRSELNAFASACSTPRSAAAEKTRRRLRILLRAVQKGPRERWSPAGRAATCPALRAGRIDHQSGTITSRPSATQRLAAGRPGRHPAPAAKLLGARRIGASTSEHGVMRGWWRSRSSTRITRPTGRGGSASSGIRPRPAAPPTSSPLRRGAAAKRTSCHDMDGSPRPAGRRRKGCSRSPRSANYVRQAALGLLTPTSAAWCIGDVKTRTNLIRSATASSSLASLRSGVGRGVR